MSEHQAAIEVRDLLKIYGGGTRAVDGITFGVAPGELFGLLGPNGAGKTTTIRILATLLRATAGTARVLGFDVAAQPQEVRKRLGLALQTVSLDAFSTGRETLELAGRLHRMPAAAVRRRADELLELMGLASVAKKLTGTYSGGMRRRLDLASALMHRPELLILDNGQIVVEAGPDELKRRVGADTVVLQLDAVAGDLEPQRAEVRRRLAGL